MDLPSTVRQIHDVLSSGDAFFAASACMTSFDMAIRFHLDEGGEHVVSLRVSPAPDGLIAAY